MRTLKNIITVMAVLSITVLAAVSCGKKDSQTPEAGVDSTMTQTAPDSTGAGAAAMDTTKAQ